MSDIIQDRVPMPAAAPNMYMIKSATGEHGPYTLDHVRELARSKNVTTADLVSINGQPWVPASQGAGIFSDKDWLTAVLLSFFLGTLGVDRFYLGHTGLGVAKLLLSWATFGIWQLIDFILILIRKVDDDQHRPLR